MVKKKKSKKILALFCVFNRWGMKMYAAILNKKLVLAVEEASLVFQHKKRLNEDNYYCPHCRHKVILVLSQSKAAFFKHLNHYERALGEKEEHHFSKLLLQTAFTAAGFRAETEVVLAAGQLRADVLVYPKLALEVQCAPLSTAEFNHRHRLYKQIGTFDLWIVGHRHYLGNKLKHTQLIFFRENQIWGKYYLEVDQAHSLLRLKYNIWQEPVTRVLHYQTAIFALDEIGLKKLWLFRPQLGTYMLNFNKQKRYLEKQIKQKSKLGLKIAEQLYQHHLTIDNLPEKIFKEWRKPGEKDKVSQYLRSLD